MRLPSLPRRRSAAPASLIDPLGPRGRCRALIGSLIAGAALIAVIAWVVYRFNERGQLESDQWDPFADPAVWRYLLGGLKWTMYLFLAAGALAIVAGLLAALGRLSRSWPVRWLAATYVEVFRAAPVMLMILFSVIVVREWWSGAPSFWLVVIGLTFYNGAMLGEIFRAGILSLERGQSEAAYAIGLTYWQAMRLVILPQAARRMIPAVVSQMITLLKDTSLVQAVGVAITFNELLRRSEINSAFFDNELQGLMVVAAIYIVVCGVLSVVARRLERRQRRRFGAAAISVAGGPEDLVANVGIDEAPPSGPRRGP